MKLFDPAGAGKPMSSRRAPDDRLGRSLQDLVIVIAGSI
jgi:hypothetical protein